MASLIILVTFLLLLILNIPISLCMMMSAISGLIAGGHSLHAITQIFPLAIQSFPLMAIPFFILAAEIMNKAGLTTRIFDFANDLVGHIKGGLGHVNVVASIIFAGMTGSNTADAAGLGRIEMKAMEEKGYSKSFSAAITAASACIGPIIPPSIILLVYGVQTGVSIGRLFLGGVIPGFLIGFLLMIQIYWFAASGREYCPVSKKTSLKQKLRSFKRAIFALMTPVIILWGMAGGYFTPTEAGVVAVVYSIIIGLIYKTIKIKDILRVILDASLSTAFILFLVAAASLLSYIITLEKIPQLAADLINQIPAGPVLIFLLISIFVFACGTIIQGVPALLILLPVLMPIVTNLGIDLVHFGLAICFNLVVGCITPPVGITLFVMCDVAKISYDEMSKAILPFLLALVASLILITLFPQLSLFLPKLIMG